MFRVTILSCLLSIAAWASSPAASEPLPLALASTGETSSPVLPDRASEGAPDTHNRESNERPVIVITLAGDTGFATHGQEVFPESLRRHDERLSWSDLTQGISGLLDGDINFSNLETVVTDRNDLPATPKTFNFRSHPDAIRHLVRAGLNVVSTANNHAADYGPRGIEETLRSLSSLRSNGLLAWPGIGLNRDEASRPADITVQGARVRISAIGIGGNGAVLGANRGSMLSYSATPDFRETVHRLSRADGDLKILSVHYGSEMQVRPSAADIKRLRDDAVRSAGIDIVVGHHAHVAAGVQEIGGRLVFYGLGNFLHPGMQDMSAHGLCRDYGLFVRIFLATDDDGRLRPLVVDAIPLTQMHRRTIPMPPEQAATRLAALNYLALSLDEGIAGGATGVRFSPRPDGSGRHCLPGHAAGPKRLADMCRDWRAADPIEPSLLRKIEASCDSEVVARRRTGSALTPAKGSTIAEPRTRTSNLSSVWAGMER